MLVRSIGAIILTAALMVPARAQNAGAQSGASDPIEAPQVLSVGMSPPSSIVAEFVSGPYADSTVCPTLASRQQPKIAIFAKKPGKAVWQLAEAVDSLVAKTPTLERSFVFFSHENDPTPTPEEYQKQLREIRQSVMDRSIRKLSVGLLIAIPDDGQVRRAKRKLGLFTHDDDVVILYVTPATRPVIGKITYVKTIPAGSLDARQIDAITGELQKAAASNN